MAVAISEAFSVSIVVIGCLRPELNDVSRGIQNVGSDSCEKDDIHGSLRGDRSALRKYQNLFCGRSRIMVTDQI